MRIFLVSLLLVLLAISSRAEVPDHLGSKDAFNLWTGCKPVGLVASLEKHETEIDLTEDEIEIATRSRLRSARLYAEELTFPFLLVSVHVVGNAFSVDVALLKPLVDRVFSGREWGGITWATGSTGTHGTNSNYILSSVSKYIDEFLDDYLRVNADSC